MATYARKLKDGNGSYICPVTRSDLVYFPDNTVLSKLTFYPVGSIYQSFDDASPASLFGGEWEKIQGRFLLGSSSSHALSSTGGEESHILTINEMPSHNHKIDTNGSIYGWDIGRLQTSNLQYQPDNATIKLCDGTYFTISSTGGSQPHNNMPPYEVVNIWKRTA